MHSISYFDYAAATPVSPAVFHQMLPFFSDKYFNPSATYTQARNVKQELELARKRVAQIIGSRPSEIIFTAGGTEANNLAIQGVMHQFPGKEVVISGVEHESVRNPAKHFHYSEAATDPDGRVNLENLRALISDETVLISVMYANNEVGVVQPLRQIAAVLHAIRSERIRRGNTLPLYFHTDGCQAANYLDMHVARLGVDMMTLNGGKIYGPKQSGSLYVSSQVQLTPLIFGGGQERGLRSGTENVAFAIGFSYALEEAQALRKHESNRLLSLQQKLVHGIQEISPNIAVNGSLRYRLPNNVHLSIPGIDNERLLLQLESEGILAAAGSACSASKEETSHVLTAMGIEKEMARSSLRFTLGRLTTEDDCIQLTEAFHRIL